MEDLFLGTLLLVKKQFLMSAEFFYFRIIWPIWGNKEVVTLLSSLVVGYLSFYIAFKNVCHADVDERLRLHSEQLRKFIFPDRSGIMHRVRAGLAWSILDRNDNVFPNPLLIASILVALSSINETNELIFSQIQTMDLHLAIGLIFSVIYTLLVHLLLVIIIIFGCGVIWQLLRYMQTVLMIGFIEVTARTRPGSSKVAGLLIAILGLAATIYGYKGDYGFPSEKEILSDPSYHISADKIQKRLALYTNNDITRECAYILSEVPYKPGEHLYDTFERQYCKKILLKDKGFKSLRDFLYFHLQTPNQIKRPI